MAARRPGTNGGAGPPGRDLAAWFLGAVTAWMPVGRRDWGRAMIAELAEIVGWRARWQFALGAARAALASPRASGPPRLVRILLTAGACVAAALGIYAAAPAAGLFAVLLPVLLVGCLLRIWGTPRPAGQAPGFGLGIQVVMGAAAAACTVLAIYTVRHFPQPAGNQDHRYALICPLLAVLLAGYTGLAFWLARMLPAGGRAARHGMSAAAVMAGCWTAGFLLHEQAGLPTTGWAWPAAIAAPCVAAALATRSTRRLEDSLMVGVWATLLGALGFFIVTVASTAGAISWYTHDRQTIADAHLHALPASVWIAGDNLGGATFMLIILPMLTLVAAVAGGALGRIASHLEPGHRFGDTASPRPVSGA